VVLGFRDILEALASDFGKAFNFCGFGGLANGEHRSLERGPWVPYLAV
jgi:hypothetical protein